jgi:Rrf2 family nitric oxide-sensitive transcriptional repressor
MRLTRYTDYAMRVLLHLAARDDGLASIGEIAKHYGISQNHLMKVVQDLGKAGFVRTVRGRGGGIALAAPADQIVVGQVVRRTEEGFQLVDCDNCLIAPACSLPRVLNEATAAFIAVLDKYTLADLMDRRSQMRSLFGITPSPPAPATAAL